MLNPALYPLLTSVFAVVLAQLLKVPAFFIKTGQVDWKQTTSSGGFPSSHSAAVTALSMAVGIQEGFYSALFAVTAVFSCIVMYDACHVRYYSGRNIALTQQLIEDLKNSGTQLNRPLYSEKLKTVLGHKQFEVLGGFVVGAIIPIVLSPVFL